jgi:hypothetical protein
VGMFSVRTIALIGRKGRFAGAVSDWRTRDGVPQGGAGRGFKNISDCFDSGLVNLDNASDTCDLAFRFGILRQQMAIRVPVYTESSDIYAYTGAQPPKDNNESLYRICYAEFAGTTLQRCGLM